MLARENNLHNHRLETSVKQIIERQVGLREGGAFPSQLIPSLIRQAMLARENNLHNHRLETSVKQIIERQVGLREGGAFPCRLLHRQVPTKITRRLQCFGLNGASY